MTTIKIIPTSILLLLLTILLRLTTVPVTNAYRIHRPWSNKPWCESVKKPEWPFAYEKYKGQLEEIKGRVSTSNQDTRHPCTTLGVTSKCHICESTSCGPTLSSTCSYQLQGVDFSDMSVNIPTVTDVPWAVNGNSRYDFAGSSTTHVCLHLSGDQCSSSNRLPTNNDYNDCELRCWGYDYLSLPVSIDHLEAASFIDNTDNTGVVTTPWMQPNPSDVWNYPKSNTVSESPRNPFNNPPLTYNPQGFVYTHAGSLLGESGSVDGPPTIARFNNPSGVAVDAEGYVYVADTGNHNIRVIAPNGYVTTLAGSSSPGNVDGIAATVKFSSPTGIAIWYDWKDWGSPSPIDPDTIVYTNGNGRIVIFVADTDNHRIRRISSTITLDPITGYKVYSDVRVNCFSGMCGNGTASFTSSSLPAEPAPGYADGNPNEARFNSPRGISVSDIGDVYVADTNNHIIRVIARNGTAYTLAGSVTQAEDDLEGGCPPPCLKGVDGKRDGNLTYAQFSFPTSVAVAFNNSGVHSLYVTDKSRVRRVSFLVAGYDYDASSDSVISDMQGVQSTGRVVTIAGQATEGETDGIGSEAQFNGPTGIIVTSDDVAYVVDSVSCRIRRITPTSQVANHATCSSTMDSMIRPSGCNSYDPPVDEVDVKLSPISGNIYYNYVHRNVTSVELGEGYVGRTIKDCVGMPPRDELDKKFWSDVTGTDPFNENLVIDDGLIDVREDANEGTTIKILCPPACVFTPGVNDIYGGPYYDSKSSICISAIHSGQITALTGGLIIVTIERSFHARTPSNITPSSSHSITSLPITVSTVQRLYTLQAYSSSLVEVHTIAGTPAGLLQEPCGYTDSIPPQEAQFNQPYSITARLNSSLDDGLYMLYVADRDNHVIRGISAVCSFVCENNGVCTAPDTCSCKPGWEGVDCTRPTCASNCAQNSLCVAPNTCACKPGYTGTNCDLPTCVQACDHGGSCTSPDTCTCSTGWFDTNCTTPVCLQTCGNGGKCTEPNTCTCPTDWTGIDCRTPVCTQTCLNGGYCTAPDTCTCPPAYSGNECRHPVCQQGYFVPNPSIYEGAVNGGGGNMWQEYHPCNVSAWCGVTEGFDCGQVNRFGNEDLVIPWSAGFDGDRMQTGRSSLQPDGPDGCALIELGDDVYSPFPYMTTPNDDVTPYQRYTDKNPYDYLTTPRAPHNAHISPTDGYTQPWKYHVDRQIAVVEFKNVSQGVYVCANNGNCTAPDTCVCATGWMGFDCRTPICEQGYFEGNDVQTTFVKGTNLVGELASFERFLGNNSYRLDPNTGYSNPEFDVQVEEFTNGTHVARSITRNGSTSYLTKGPTGSASQGGYECSIRAVTQWEDYRNNHVHEHPNFYSRYMDTKVEDDMNTYTHWVNMEWPATHGKSQKLEFKGGTVPSGSTLLSSGVDFRYGDVRVREENVDGGQVLYTYTDSGYMREGVWTMTGAGWAKGTCIVEFNRTCTGDGSERKAFDLQANADVRSNNLLVQDTDLAFRPRVTYSNTKAFPFGRWSVTGGECVDQVIRGCFNNGTCSAPNTCTCAQGWEGYDCMTPICSQPCGNGGNCTLPNTCTCEKGWKGQDCTVAVCAQECNNYGTCVQPDTCECLQWQNTFFDGSAEGGRPLFRTDTGEAQMTGWTGYDCATPICVQSLRFITNIDKAMEDVVTILGGHGKDGKLECNDVRCNVFLKMVTMNDGKSFQTGCGFDPIYTGCCDTVPDGERADGVLFVCHRCRSTDLIVTEHSVVCHDMFIESFEYVTEADVSLSFKTNGLLNLCGRYHNPGGRLGVNAAGERTNVDYYVSERAEAPTWFSSRNGLSNVTSNSFLCERFEWEQGEYYTATGRHVRVNHPNFILTGLTNDRGFAEWTIGPVVRGEGIYECYNGGSCIGPDECTCTDGWAGLDCNEPLCRHMQKDTSIVACLNGGICASRDDCKCIQTVSVLWKVHETAKRGLTGWSGTDCSMPMCTQGFYNPFCDIENAPGGEGCYMCANGGTCSAPDFCTCSQGWSGYDCRTPVCEVVANFLIRKQLNTIDEEKVHQFESDPCSMREIYDAVRIPGREGEGEIYYRGNCTLPNQCTCLCFEEYNAKSCELRNKNCAAPWQDLDLYILRNVLPIGYMFGSRNCAGGYEGALDEFDRFTSCHLSIFIPNFFERHTYYLSIFGSVGFVVFGGIYVFMRRRLKRKYILAKIERRKSRRSSEESVTNAGEGAFAY